MVYRNDIPQGADRPSSPSRGQILENFSQLDSQYGTSGDHVEFSAASNNGKHKKSTYIATSDPTTAAAEVALYAKTVSSNTELYLRQVSAGTIVQMTKGVPTIAGNATGTSKGHSFLPGGILIQWGSLAASTGGTPFTFDTSFTTIYSIVGGIQAAGAQAISFSGVNTEGATVYSASGPQTINYIAIGI